MKSIVHKQNLEFLHHKSHYSFAYFQFMKNFLIVNGNHIKSVLDRNPHMAVSVLFCLPSFCYLICILYNFSHSSSAVGDGETWSSVCSTGNYLSLPLWHSHEEDTQVLLHTALVVLSLSSLLAGDLLPNGMMLCSHSLCWAPQFGTGLLTTCSSRTETDSQSTCWNVLLQRLKLIFIVDVLLLLLSILRFGTCLPR